MTRNVLNAVYAEVDRRAPDFVDDLCDLIRRPSRTGHLEEVEACAAHIASVLAAKGWKSEIAKVDELAPVIFSERPAPDGTPTLLLYSHYDVITPEPIDEWTYPPFSATRIDGRIVGRGSSDAKANVLALVNAVDLLTEVRGEPPCGIKLMLDGEEEAGSANLPTFMDQYRSRLDADAVMSFDGSIDATGVPKIGLGTAGMLFVELTAKGANAEVHSALQRLYVNAAWRLVWALASIKGVDEQVLIRGFYEAIRPPTERDRDLMRAMPWDDRRHLDGTGLEGFLTGVTGYDAIERLLFQPGLTICGFESGYTGEGMKAIIPSTATAKLEFRIVPDQTPQGTLDQLRRHLDEAGFADIDVRTLATVETAKTDPDAEIVHAAVAAAEEHYGAPMLKPTEEYAGRQGAWLGELLGIPGVQTGVGPPGARAHATDEFVTEEHFLRGIKYASSIIDRFGRGSADVVAP